MSLATSFGSITITDITDGSHIWTSSQAPTVNGGQYVFNNTYLSGPQNAVPKIGDIIFYETYKYDISSSTANTSIALSRQDFQGEDGYTPQKGIDYFDGTSSYTWIRYATDDKGSGFTATPSSTTKYIGVITSTVNTQPTATQFNGKWQKYVGENGQSIKGDDGKTFYLHIAYADNANGTSGFDKVDGTNKSYIGVYKDETEADSNNPSDYTWSKIKGEDGYTPRKGIDYFDGTSSYTWIRYATDNIGTGFTSTPSSATKYIGVVTTTTATQPSSDQFTGKWQKYVGENGQSIKGDDGKTFYLHIAYANSADGTSGFDKVNGTNKSYIGVYKDEIEADSNSPASYTWSKIKGEDGTSYYTYVRYSANANGSGMATSPTADTKYIGIYTGTSSTVPAYTSFVWSKYVGTDGTNGTSISSVTPLYYCSNSATAPALPTATVTINSVSEYNKWNKAVATYTTTYKYYFVCSEILYSNNNRTWSSAVRDSGLETANSNASTAVTTANTAKNTADAAATAASNAAKVATNYLNFNDTDGLVVGNQTASTLTGNVQIKATPEVSLRDGTKVMARFTKSAIEFFDTQQSTARSVASFGIDGARIGISDAQRFAIDSDSIKAYNNSNIKYFDVSENGITFGTKAAATLSDLETTEGKISSLKSEVDNQISTLESGVTGVQGTIGTLNTALTTASQDIENIKKDISTLQQDVNKYMYFDPSKGLVIGTNENNFKTVLSNDKLAFQQSGVEVAYVGSNRFQITNGTILNELVIGKYAFIPRSDGAISLQWKG